MAKPLKSITDRKKDLIDEQDYLSEEQKEAEKKDLKLEYHVYTMLLIE